MKLSQIQSDRDEIESKLSVVQEENLTLKSENKRLIGHVSTAKEQARQKVYKNEMVISFLLVISRNQNYKKPIKLLKHFWKRSPVSKKKR